MRVYWACSLVWLETLPSVNTQSPYMAAKQAIGPRFKSGHAHYGIFQAKSDH